MYIIISIFSKFSKYDTNHPIRFRFRVSADTTEFWRRRFAELEKGIPIHGAAGANLKCKSNPIPSSNPDPFSPFVNLFNDIPLLDEHDSPQWYDIVHFEHKLSWLCFGFPQKASYQWS